MYASGILRMYADWRPGSRSASGEMSPGEMGAVFTAFHEALKTAFGGTDKYVEGGQPVHSTYVNQILPLVWHYNFYQLYGR